MDKWENDTSMFKAFVILILSFIPFFVAVAYSMR